MPGVKDIHVPTAPGDGGLSLGAALAYYFSYNERCKVADTAFIGCKIVPIEPNDSDNITYKKIFKQYILRIAIALLAFTFISSPKSLT